MCNILLLKPGQMPYKEEFINMCYNNWHSYGIVTKIGDRFDIKRVVPELGEIDPLELWALVERDRQYERLVHVRHTTAGATNLDNCQPFDVYFQERKGKAPLNIVFGHNGTLYDYKSKKISESGAIIDDPSGPSDTKNFVDQILIPFVSSTDFGTGRGDLNNPLMKTLLQKFWPLTSNRGILYSSGHSPILLGDWKKVKAVDGSEILSANDEYFKTVSRGPEYTRRMVAEQMKKDKENSFRPSTVITSTKEITSSDIVPYTAFDFHRKDKQHGAYHLNSYLSNVLSDYHVWDRSTAVALGAATQDELKELYEKDKKDTVILMDWIFSDYATLYGEFTELEEKHKKATDRIASIMGELNELRVWCKENGHFDKKVA